MSLKEQQNKRFPIELIVVFLISFINFGRTLFILLLIYLQLAKQESYLWLFHYVDLLNPTILIHKMKCAI